MEVLSWLGELSTGTLASIIASIIFGAIVGYLGVKKTKRKSKLKISSSEIGGDVVVGDKRQTSIDLTKNSVDKRTFTTSIKDTKINGDIVQGDKEG